MSSTSDTSDFNDDPPVVDKRRNHQTFKVKQQPRFRAKNHGYSMFNNLDGLTTPLSAKNISERQRELIRHQLVVLVDKINFRYSTLTDLNELKNLQWLSELCASNNIKEKLIDYVATIIGKSEVSPELVKDVLTKFDISQINELETNKDYELDYSQMVMDIEYEADEQEVLNEQVQLDFGKEDESTASSSNVIHSAEDENIQDQAGAKPTRADFADSLNGVVVPLLIYHPICCNDGFDNSNILIRNGQYLYGALRMYSPIMVTNNANHLKLGRYAFAVLPDTKSIELMMKQRNVCFSKSDARALSDLVASLGNREKCFVLEQPPDTTIFQTIQDNPETEPILKYYVGASPPAMFSLRKRKRIATVDKTKRSRN